MSGRPLALLRPRLAALVLVLPLLLDLSSTTIGWPAKLLSLLLLGLSLMSPHRGLIALAALLPFAPPNTLVVPVLLGGFLRVDDRTPSARWPALLVFGLLVLISAGTSGLHAHHEAVTWLEALALAALAARIARVKGSHGVRIAQVMVMSAGLAAISSAIAFWQFVRHDPSQMSALSALLTVRIAPGFSDVNAAGSYFALSSVAAACLGFTSPRKWPWIVAATLLLFALWLAGSRAALASVVVVTAAAWAMRQSQRRVAVASVSVLAIAAVGYLTLAPPTRVPQASAGYAVRVRVEMMKVGLHLAAEHPIAGVGIGRFQEASRSWISPSLIAQFPPAASGENAHNNFVQILAEVGVPGLVAFGWILAGPAVVYWRGVRRDGLGPEPNALAAGLLAFLLTCLVGHPLLSTQVLLTFFFALGLLRGLADEQQIH